MTTLIKATTRNALNVKTDIIQNVKEDKINRRAMTSVKKAGSSAFSGLFLIF